MAYSDFTLPELKQRFQLTVEEASNLWQNLIGAVHEGLEADAHGVDSQTGTPSLGVAFLFPVDFADVGSLFVGYGRFAETLEHGVLALQNFFHIPLHEENPVMKQFRF